MKNVIDMFRRLKGTKQQYIVMYEWQNMPAVVPLNVELLVTNINSFATTLGLTPAGAPNVFDAFFNDGGKQRLILHQIGTGRYPSQFERALIAKGIMHNDVIRAPEQTLAFWMLMYDLVHRTDRFDREEKRVILPVLDQRTGPYVARTHPVPAPTIR